MFLYKTHLKEKGKPQTGKKYFAKHLSDKGLIARMYKEPYNSVLRREPNFLKKAQDLKKYFKENM